MLWTIRWSFSLVSTNSTASHALSPPGSRRAAQDAEDDEEEEGAEEEEEEEEEELEAEEPVAK